ncbi:hypothetical protein QE152_g282 [Popillia japonica]|uniref:BACK domain-containing protein n=1 Tax=Popillia japonica TaxID=7064 RepID=A0AAW1NK54_POPJA
MRLLQQQLQTCKIVNKISQCIEDDEFDIPLYKLPKRWANFDTTQFPKSHLHTFEVEDFATIDHNLMTSDVYSDGDIVNLVKHWISTDELENSNDEEEEEPCN